MPNETAELNFSLGSSKFSGGGICIAFALIGFLLLALALDLATRGGRDASGSSAMALVAAAVAQGNSTRGWVYAPEGSFTGLGGNLIGNTIQAQRPVRLRENHFDDLTGTFVGSLLGYAEPNVVGEIEQHDCVRVEEDHTVGFGKVWLNVEKVECPDPPHTGTQ